MKILLIAVVVVTGAVAAPAQVSVSTDQSADKSHTASQVAISVGDHTFVPLTVETKKAVVGPDTTAVESTTQARRDDGTYFDWRTTKTETKKLSDSASITTSDTVEKDREGGVRVTKSTTERVTKSPDGTEQATTSEYHRNASGNLVLARESTAVSKPNPDGSISTMRTESLPDVNGNLQPVQRVEEKTTKISDNESQTSRTTQTANHMDASYTDSAKETQIVRKDGDQTVTETLVQKPSNGNWQNQARIITTETHLPDGTTQRETVEQSRPAYAPDSHGKDSLDSLVPREKVVEREVRRPDGTTEIDRQVLHRDVNGDWKAATFSTEAAQKGY